MLCITIGVIFAPDTFNLKIFLRNGAVIQHPLIKIHLKPFQKKCLIISTHRRDDAVSEFPEQVERKQMNT